jgi:hypothetical protein
MLRTKRFARAVVAAFLAGANLLAGLGAIEAQVAPPAHLAFIYTGTCAERGDVAYPLTPILSTEFATPEAAAGAATANRAASSVTTLDVALAALLAAPHAIAVQHGEAGTGQSIVCGDIGGVVTNGDLAVGLQEVDESGDVGLAVLHTAGSGITVTVYLVHALAADSTTPDGGIIAVSVTLTDTRIAATQTTFRVGVAYAFVVSNLSTIENELLIAVRGETDHPLVAGNDQASVTAIPPGQSKTLTWTFTEPGSYVLACRVPGRFEMRTFLAIDVTATSGPGTIPNPVPPPQPVKS